MSLEPSSRGYWLTSSISLARARRWERRIDAAVDQLMVISLMAERVVERVRRTEFDHRTFGDTLIDDLLSDRSLAVERIGGIDPFSGSVAKGPSGALPPNLIPDASRQLRQLRWTGRKGGATTDVSSRPVWKIVLRV